jgi:O-antigen/teichoic acid export membrane protein
LAGIFILSKTTPPSLLSLGLVTGLAPLVVIIVASLVLFHTRYKQWKPVVKQIDFKVARNMVSIGFKFFVAGCAFLVVSQTLPILIQRATNPVEVTNFNTVFRLFSMGLNIIVLIITPFWSSFTDAYTQQDFTWMKKSFSLLRLLFFCFVGVEVILLLFSPTIYDLWINHWIKDIKNNLIIPWSLSLLVCLYTCVLCWVAICIQLINGIGKLKIQFYSSLVEMLFFIPLALWLGERWGTLGIVFASILIYIPRMIWAPLQLTKLIQGKSEGLWVQ